MAGQRMVATIHDDGAAAAEPIRSRMSARTIFPSTQDRTVSSMKFGSSSSPQMHFHRLKSNSTCQRSL
jgi:hypothetical protein